MSGVQSVDRAITSLELIAERGEAGIGELATALGVHTSTVSRLLGVLADHGLIEQVDGGGTYRLGFALIPLAGRVAERLEVTTHAHPICADLAARLGETVTIAIPDRGRAVTVDQARGPAMVTAHNWLGRSTPLHNTSTGKVLLAAVGAADPDALATALAPETHLSRRALRALAAELAQVAARGYAWALEEYEPGLHAVAAPIHGPDGAVIAALSVSGPAYRLSAQRITEIAPDVVAAGHEISDRITLHRP